MDFYQYLLERYGYDEPIFSDELTKEINFMEKATIRQALKRLVDGGKVIRYANGIFFIPNPKSILKSKSLSVNKIINKKYLYKNNGRIGYLTGLSFANSLKLTTQNPGIIEIATVVEKRAIRVVDFKKRKIALRKPRVEINDDNYKLLQVLDLVTNFEKVSTKPIRMAAQNIIDYLKDVTVTKTQLNDYLRNYPAKTYKHLIESELYNELTRG